MDIWIPPSQIEVTQRKLETFNRYSQVIQWGRKDPVAFCERFFKLKLIDFQKYALYESWYRDFILWLECRNAGKSTLMGVYAMLRSVLIPGHKTYFIGNTGEQAKETFKKLEKIAKGEIESFTGSTDIFMNELKKGINSDGFIHDPASFKCELFNTSEIFTLNSNIINIKGKRANLVCYDEAAWFNQELFVQTEQFVNQDENFSTNVDKSIDTSLEPPKFSRQLLYASSASDTSFPFYEKYRSFSEQMILGNPLYFVCDFNLKTIMNTTIDGDPSTPLISQDKVDKALADDKERATRELFNKFSADTHEGQIVSRRDILVNSKKRPPILKNDGSRLFIAAYDSARMTDNSILGWAELINDPDRGGWCMEIQNVISMVDINSRNKTPLRLPEQVERLKCAIIDYNGSELGKPDYENIRQILMDAGAGGGMIGGISDNMLANWEGKDGKTHKGIIDKSHRANESAIRTYPEALDIATLVEPRAHRNECFDAAEKMTKLGVVGWPADAEGRDYIITVDDDGNENKYDLSPDEQIALAQIELMKNEIVTMCKYNNQGSITYNFPPDLRNKMHDDRAFVYALLCWYLAQLRRGQIVKKAIPKRLDSAFEFKAPVRRK